MRRARQAVWVLDGSEKLRARGCVGAEWEQKCCGRDCALWHPHLKNTVTSKALPWIATLLLFAPPPLPVMPAPLSIATIHGCAATPAGAMEQL